MSVVETTHRLHMENKKLSRNVNIMGKTVPLLPLALSVLLALTSGVAIAQWFTARQVDISMHIVAYYGMELYDPDLNPLTTIALGFLHRGEVKEFPGYRIANDGEADIYVSWTMTGLPLGVTVDMMYSDGSLNDVLLEDVIDPRPIVAGNMGYFGFTITIPSDAAFASYDPVLTWNGYESTTP